jgi:CubicO group peptidase (beta-lactamase class C family)
LRAQGTASRLDAYVESQVTAKKFMGSVLVARGGEVLLAKGYGFANLEHKVPNKVETKYR